MERSSDSAPTHQGRQAEVLAAAERQHREDRERPGGDRHRTGQPAGRLRAAVQHPGGLYAGANLYHRGHQGRKQRQRGHGCRDHRLHGGHRHRRRDGQRLLLRALRLAWRARCTTTTGTISTTIARTRARIGTKPGGRPRGCPGQPGGRPRGCPGQPRRLPGVAKRGHRAPSSNARIKSRRASRPQSTAQTSRAAGTQTAAGTRRPTAPPRRATRPAARTATGRAPEPSGAAPIGRVFQLLQRQVGALGQRPRETQPLVEWRRQEPPMTGRMTSMAVLLIAAWRSSRVRGPRHRKSGSPRRRKRWPP